jgi:hypothetical protein
LESDPKSEVPKPIRACGTAVELVVRASKSADRLRGEVHSAVRGSLGNRSFASWRLHDLSVLYETQVVIRSALARTGERLDTGLEVSYEFCF